MSTAARRISRLLHRPNSSGGGSGGGGGGGGGGDHANDEPRSSGSTETWPSSPTSHVLDSAHAHEHDDASRSSLRDVVRRTSRSLSRARDRARSRQRRSTVASDDDSVPPVPVAATRTPPHTVVLDAFAERAVRPRTRSRPPDTPLVSSPDRYSEEVAERNMAHSSPRSSRAAAATSSPLDRSSQREPLIEIPQRTTSLNKGSTRSTPAKPIYDSPDPIDISSIVDLTDSVQTHLHLRQARAVTHETRYVHTHNVVREAITREIHQDHIIHRVLPVVDVEVLPVRHFVPSQDGQGRVEIPAPDGGEEDELLRQAMQRAAEETLLPAPSSDEKDVGRRRFTARKFEGEDCEASVSTAEEGFPRTEQWWVHPPRLAEGAREQGETRPFHLGSGNRKRDGLREDDEDDQEEDDDDEQQQQQQHRTMTLPVRTSKGFAEAGAVYSAPAIGSASTARAHQADSKRSRDDGVQG